MNVQLHPASDRHLFWNGALAGVIFGAFRSEKRGEWSGLYRAPAAPPAGEAERRVRAAVAAMQDWHFRLKAGESPDPGDLEALQRLTQEEEWVAVDPAGGTTTLLAPRFERWGMFWLPGEVPSGPIPAPGETVGITLTAYADRPIQGCMAFAYEDLELWYGAAPIGVLLNSFTSDDSWYGLFRQPAERGADAESNRVGEFIQFSQEWHTRAEEGDPDAEEFDVFNELLTSPHWSVIDRQGVSRSIECPVFYAGEASWRER